MNAPAPQTPFSIISLPKDGLHLNGELYFSLAQIADHLNISRSAIHKRMRDGDMAYIHQPGLTNGKKLVHADELKRFLTYGAGSRK